MTTTATPLFGLATLSPEEAAALIRSALYKEIKAADAQIRFFSARGEVSPRAVTGPVLAIFETVEGFRSGWKKADVFRAVTVGFICDAALELVRVPGCVALDYVATDPWLHVRVPDAHATIKAAAARALKVDDAAYRTYSFEAVSQVAKRESLHLSIQQFYKNSLIANMTSLMFAMSPKHRTDMRAAVCEMLMGRLACAALAEKAKALAEASKERSQVQEALPDFLTFLVQEGETYVAYYSGKTKQARSKAAKRLQMSPFEQKYIARMMAENGHLSGMEDHASA